MRETVIKEASKLPVDLPKTLEDNDRLPSLATVSVFPNRKIHRMFYFLRK